MVAQRLFAARDGESGGERQARAGTARESVVLEEGDRLRGRLQRTARRRPEAEAHGAARALAEAHQRRRVRDQAVRHAREVLAGAEATSLAERDRRQRALDVLRGEQ